MRIFGSRCREFEYAPLSTAVCSIGIDPSAVGAKKIFFDCLLLNVAIGREDRDAVPLAVAAIRKLAADSDASYLVIDGTPQWPAVGGESSTADDALTALADSLDIAAEIAERLEELGERVHLIPFGWNVSCRMGPLDSTHLRPVVHVWDSGDNSGMAFKPISVGYCDNNHVLRRHVGARTYPSRTGR